MSEMQNSTAGASVTPVVKVKLTDIPSLEVLLQAGVHFGHRTAKWYPKMKQYIFGVRHGVHIIDLEQTAIKLKAATAYVADIAARGGKILFVGTKKQVKNIIKQVAESCGMPYINERWLGGTFTNFSQIAKLAKRYKELKAKIGTADYAKYTKKEQSVFTEEIEYLEKKVGGILGLERLPQAVFIVGLKEEETAVKEAISIGIPIIALCDTNTDPTHIAYPIPANDDAVRSVQVICQTIADAIAANKSA